MVRITGRSERNDRYNNYINLGYQVTKKIWVETWNSTGSAQSATVYSNKQISGITSETGGIAGVTYTGLK